MPRLICFALRYYRHGILWRGAIDGAEMPFWKTTVGSEFSFSTGPVSYPTAETPAPTSLALVKSQNHTFEAGILLRTLNTMRGRGVFKRPPALGRPPFAKAFNALPATPAGHESALTARFNAIVPTFEAGMLLKTLVVVSRGYPVTEGSGSGPHFPMGWNAKRFLPLESALCVPPCNSGHHFATFEAGMLLKTKNRREDQSPASQRRGQCISPGLQRASKGLRSH
jgi:hypothetical protein